MCRNGCSQVTLEWLPDPTLHYFDRLIIHTVLAANIPFTVMDDCWLPTTPKVAPDEKKSIKIALQLPKQDFYSFKLCTKKGFCTSRWSELPWNTVPLYGVLTMTKTKVLLGRPFNRTRTFGRHGQTRDDSIYRVTARPELVQLKRTTSFVTGWVLPL